MDSTFRTLALRSSIVIGLATTVATILYFTPLPNRYPRSCSRPCHELDWPMICRVKLTLERYQTLSSACAGCPNNMSDCYHKNCITADGLAKGILTVNRQFPGPNIQVCQNDIIVVDVVNQIPGQSFGIHWRGQPQRESPHMDGVPMVTQCPIPSFTTFQYKFRASDSGTHMWQVNTGEEALPTLFGGFIVRQPNSQEQQRHLYDTDEPGHVVTIHTWSPHSKVPFLRDSEARSALLINGKTQENGMPAALFNVTSGKRHRFRVLFGGETSTCQVRLSIDSHPFLVIALDGHSIIPRMVNSIRLSFGERVDFVLQADRAAATYDMKVSSAGNCEPSSEVSAFVRYEGAQSDLPADGAEASARAADLSELTTIHDAGCDSSNKESVAVCLNKIHGLYPIPKELSTEKPDASFYLFFGFTLASSHNISNTTFIAIDEHVKVPRTNNLTMMFPPSPLLSQPNDVNSDILCNSDEVPARCRDNRNEVCECVHVLHVALGDVIEIILVGQATETPKDHVFHLHGYSFYVTGVTQLTKPLHPQQAINLDKENKLVQRILESPIQKDTLTVPENGVAVLRFKADNPGYWLLDEEHSSYWSRGMSVILHVGEHSDLPETPKNFPKCGNWIGPEFFLV